MIMSRDENIVRNGTIKIGDLSFEEVEKFKYLGATVTNINDTREEIKRRINMGNACYYSVEKLLSSCLLSKNLKVRIYKTVILLVVLYGCETWTLTLREEQRLRVFENKVLRKIFGAKRDEVTGEWRVLHNAELHALYPSHDIIRNIKSRRLRWAGHVAQEQRLRVFENKIFRKIFGTKTDEVTGEWRKLHNTELHTVYSSPDIIRNTKSRRLRLAGHLARMGESRNAYRVLVGRPEGKRPLGRPRRRWEDNIKMDLREVGYDDRERINLAQDRDQWRAYVRAAMNLQTSSVRVISSETGCGARDIQSERELAYVCGSTGARNELYIYRSPYLDDFALTLDVHSIYKTVILPVVLYGCETWTLTLREEHRLRVFENKVLRKIFGAKRDEVTGEWRKLHNAELHALYSSPDIIRNIKSRRLRWAGHVAHMGESRNAYRVLVGRPEGKRPLGRPRRRWEDNIKMDLREVGYDDRDWINLAQDRDRWRAL
ncbi:hypothetical protein ANN_18468 [Periplaneta americana]|uniref:Endonuclease-reverse transcriptase n=1 Tax=Periplaneta americana TaxID=6978 RepID=A0ABQ8SNU6_PERAM|nr:hypothetical protein ANN_18468 [Periplaneta americana]